MATDLLALGIVAIVVGSFLFYKMKAMAAAERTEREADVRAAKARAMALLFVGALLTAASIPANLLASSPPSAPAPGSSSGASSAEATPSSSAAAVPSTSTPTPTPTPSATPTAVPRPRYPGGRYPPVRRK